MTRPVTVYSTPTCPDCRTLKAWLARLDVDFVERDLTDPSVMDEAKRRFGVRVAPIIEVGDWFTFGTFSDIRPRVEIQLREAGVRRRDGGQVLAGPRGESAETGETAGGAGPARLNSGAPFFCR